MEKLPENREIIKTVSFWTEEIKKAGVYDKLKFFNDIVTEKRPPHPSAGYGNPIFTDVLLDGKNVDIYHSDHNGGSWHRLFLHIKDPLKEKEIKDDKKILYEIMNGNQS